MKYRVVPILYNNATMFKLQKKTLWWWSDIGKLTATKAGQIEALEHLTSGIYEVG